MCERAISFVRRCTSQNSLMLPLIRSFIGMEWSQWDRGVREDRIQALYFP